ncbi:MAG: hypothetical protein CMK89_01275 [Pseudomonadales bacterium]|nr:hypothetical protein [Pseudomonadales bacterium]RLU01915.1 MAG: hypothetical protein D9N11_11310 [Ketobacter sp.]
MLQRVSVISSVIRQNLMRWCVMTLGIVAAYYALLMLSLIARFGHLPNYVNVFDWWTNVIRIIESTPSISDSIAIIKDEWLLEIGYMNYDFGMGISEWSLFIVPVKVLGVTLLGALVSTNYLLLRQSSSCSGISKLEARSSGTATGIGATLMATASITLSWVVCCSTPTWVVGLAMLGLGATTALWLEPLGTWLNIMGLIILLGVCIHLARPGIANTKPMGELS